MAGNDRIKRILVRAPNWIGDAVMCLPALSSLKKLFPKAEITVLAKGRAVPVFQNNPEIKDIIEYDDRNRHKGISGRIRLSAEIKRKDFELAVLFQNAFDAAFLAFVARIPKRAGYARDLRSRLLTMPVKVTTGILKKHQAFYYLNIVKELGGKVPEAPAPKIHIGRNESAWARDFFKENGLNKDLLAGTAPGASYGPAKRWMPENFAGALNGLSRSHGLVPVIFGGPEDKQACEGVSAGIKGRHLNLAGKVTLREFIALLAHMRVFITNDSGPMHLSAALGVPTVAVFGSTDPSLTGPLGKAVKVVRKEIECSPCFERTCRYGHYKCLSSVTVEDICGPAGSFLSGVKKQAP